MKVVLRQKPLKSGDYSLYLDIYKDGKRKYEFLKLYLKAGKVSLIKQQNKEVLRLAENIRAKRLLEMQTTSFGFTSEIKKQTMFLDYFEQKTKERYSSLGNYGNWRSTLIHLKRFCNHDIRLVDIDPNWLHNLKNYFKHMAKTPNGQNLSQNTLFSYYNKIKACLREAHETGIIDKNPAILVKGFKEGETQREFLSLDELKTLSKTTCKLQCVKKAFIFSCLTGLRFSDIKKLTWEEVRDSENGSVIYFKQKKTDGLEYLPISNQAREIIGERKEEYTNAVQGLRYSAHHSKPLKDWIKNAGITKHITFHSARHTFATLQITYGTDIYTVSKLLGHRHLQTTEIYAKLVDEKKVNAVNAIPNL